MLRPPGSLALGREGPGGSVSGWRNNGRPLFGCLRLIAWRCHIVMPTSRVIARTLLRHARGLGTRAAGLECGRCSDRAPSSLAPPARRRSAVRAAPQPAAPFGRPPSPAVQSAGRCRRVPCPAPPARPCGTGRDPRASPRPDPPGPERPSPRRNPAKGISISRWRRCPMALTRSEMF